MYSKSPTGVPKQKSFASADANLAPGVLMMLLNIIFAVVNSAVLVAKAKRYSIRCPPAVTLTLSFSGLCSL